MAQSIFDIDFQILKKNGINFLLSDLDNTLDPIKTKDPSDRAMELISRINEAGITLIIVSNNTGKRVKRYAKELGVRCASGMAKPFSGKMKRFLQENGISKDEAILIGDQIMTDVVCGNGSGLRTILTKPLVKQEPPWTKFNRLFERPKRKKVEQLELAKDWRESFK